MFAAVRDLRREGYVPKPLWLIGGCGLISRGFVRPTYSPGLALLIACSPVSELLRGLEPGLR
jgi:hypothetical protein